MPVQAITAITFSTLITIIIPGEAVEGTVEWDLLEQLEDLEAVDSREVVVMEVVGVGVLADGVGEVDANMIPSKSLVTSRTHK